MTCSHSPYRCSTTTATGPWASTKYDRQYQGCLSRHFAFVVADGVWPHVPVLEKLSSRLLPVDGNWGMKCGASCHRGHCDPWGKRQGHWRLLAARQGAREATGYFQQSPCRKSVMRSVSALRRFIDWATGPNGFCFWETAQWHGAPRWSAVGGGRGGGGVRWGWSAVGVECGGAGSGCVACKWNLWSA